MQYIAELRKMRHSRFESIQYAMIRWFSKWYIRHITLIAGTTVYLHISLCVDRKIFQCQHLFLIKMSPCRRLLAIGFTAAAVFGLIHLKYVELL